MAAAAEKLTRLLDELAAARERGDVFPVSTHAESLYSYDAGRSCRHATRQPTALYAPAAALSLAVWLIVHTRPRQTLAFSSYAQPDRKVDGGASACAVTALHCVAALRRQSH